MKKTIILGLTVLLLIGFFAACGAVDKEIDPLLSDQNEGEEQEGLEADEPEVTDDPPGEEDPIEEEDQDKEPTEGDDPIDEPIDEDLTGLGFFEAYGLDKETEKRVIDDVVIARLSEYDFLGEEDYRKRIGWAYYQNYTISGYFGTYNGFVIVRRWPWWGESSSSQRFDGIRFHFLEQPTELQAWKDGIVYDNIEDLYKQGLLTQEDIIQIAENRFQTKYGIPTLEEIMDIIEGRLPIRQGTAAFNVIYN